MPISYTELANLPEEDKKEILRILGDRILTTKRALDVSIDSQKGKGKKGLVYATVGHHPKEARGADGRSRGPQSNPTIISQQHLLPVLRYYNISSS